MAKRTLNLASMEKLIQDAKIIALADSIEKSAFFCNYVFLLNQHLEIDEQAFKFHRT